MAKTASKKTSKEKTLNIYIGWDSREPIAADVCKYSIHENTSIPTNVVYLQQDNLRDRELYWRDVDQLSSTEFTFTRFLTPYLNNYEGYAIFVDCDFLFTGDIADLMEQIDPEKAVTVVQHDYTPPEGTKMDGQKQLAYPRKNWSSMIVWNCGHPKNKTVDLNFVNNATGQELHRFTWLDDDDIGNLNPEWNWLVGWYREYRDGFPKALHYTEGGPWFDEYKKCEYAEVWNTYRDRFHDFKRVRPGGDVDDLDLPDHVKEIITTFLHQRKDPKNYWYKANIAPLMKELASESRAVPCIGVLDADPDIESEIRKMDVYIDAFLQGSDGVLTMSKNTPDFDRSIPVVIRGIAKRKVIHRCEQEKRPYFYIDTGYFGNWKHKTFHRITKNNMQYLGKINPGIPEDRFVRTGATIHKHRPGTNILICPPSQKAMNFWGLDLNEWLDFTVQEIKKYTDRPIVIRTKTSRSERVNNDTMEMALSRDVHCMVTFNSIAAVESLMYGKPVFTMGPNAAQPFANLKLDTIDNPFMPTLDEVRILLCNLAYQQFTTQEMKDGTAWRMLNGE